MSEGEYQEHVEEQHESTVVTEPVPPAEPYAMEPVEEVPAQPSTFKGTPEAGLQRIRAAIRILETHSAARIGGGIIGEALGLLEEGYAVLVEHHPAKA